MSLHVEDAIVLDRDDTFVSAGNDGYYRHPPHHPPHHPYNGRSNATAHAMALSRVGTRYEPGVTTTNPADSWMAFHDKHGYMDDMPFETQEQLMETMRKTPGMVPDDYYAVVVEGPAIVMASKLDGSFQRGVNEFVVGPGREILGVERIERDRDGETMGPRRKVAVAFTLESESAMPSAKSGERSRGAGVRTMPWITDLIEPLRMAFDTETYDDFMEEEVYSMDNDAVRDVLGLDDHDDDIRDGGGSSQDLSIIVPWKSYHTTLEVPQRGAPSITYPVMVDLSRNRAGQTLIAKSYRKYGGRKTRSLQRIRIPKQILGSGRQVFGVLEDGSQIMKKVFIKVGAVNDNIVHAKNTYVDFETGALKDKSVAFLKELKAKVTTKKRRISDDAS